MMTPVLFISCRSAADRAATVARGFALAASVLLVLAPLPSRGHEGGLELTVSPTEVAAGDEVTVSGEGFTANAQLEFHLTGPNGDAHFEKATADEEGAFTRPVQIPGDVVPGLYLIRAEGADQEASTELTVGAMAGMAATTTDVLPERDRALIWRTIAVVLFLGVGVVGIVLVRPTRPGIRAWPSA